MIIVKLLVFIIAFCGTIGLQVRGVVEAPHESRQLFFFSVVCEGVTNR